MDSATNDGLGNIFASAGSGDLDFGLEQLLAGESSPVRWDPELLPSLAPLDHTTQFTGFSLPPLPVLPPLSLDSTLTHEPASGVKQEARDAAPEQNGPVVPPPALAGRGGRRAAAVAAVATFTAATSTHDSVGAAEDDDEYGDEDLHDDQDMGSDMDDETLGGLRTASNSNGGISKRRRRIRNAKQQELNRLAQQRYRQRKKQRQVDLQQAVDQLSSQLQQLKAKDVQLEAQQREIGSLRQQLTQQQQELQAAHDSLAQYQRTDAELRGLMCQQHVSSTFRGMVPVEVPPAAQQQQAAMALLTARLKQALLQELASCSNADDNNLNNRHNASPSQSFTSATSPPGLYGAYSNSSISSERTAALKAVNSSPALQAQLSAVLSRTIQSCWQDVLTTATAPQQLPLELPNVPPAQRTTSALPVPCF